MVGFEQLVTVNFEFNCQTISAPRDKLQVNKFLAEVCLIMMKLFRNFLETVKLH